MPDHKPSLLTLFLSVFKISAFTFGGGYVIVPLMRKRFAQQLHWVSDEEMLDMIAIAQSAPGPIAVNTSIILGYKVLGLKGALVAVLGTALPPLVVLTLISLVYEAFITNKIVATFMEAMRAGVAAVIADVAWTMASGIARKKQPTPIILMALAFIAVYFFKAPIILVLLACGLVGLSDAWLRGQRKEATP